MLLRKEGTTFAGQRGPVVEEIKFVAEEKDGEIEGYASIFGEIDRGGDIVEKGAFLDSLGRYPAGKVKLLWQHDPSQVIGKWTDLAEDERGLRARGVIFDTQRGSEVKMLLREGAVDGLSIGYRVVEDAYDHDSDVRKLVKVELREISVVTFPMNEGATITRVKNGNKLPTEREFERFLRDVGGFSNMEAKRIISEGFRSLSDVRDDVASEEMAEAKRALAELTARLRAK